MDEVKIHYYVEELPVQSLSISNMRYEDNPMFYSDEIAESLIMPFSEASSDDFLCESFCRA
jgi:hypothetical protein